MAVKQLHLTIEIPPVSKLRTQTVIVHGRRMTYTPAKTRNTEKELKRILLPFKKTVSEFVGSREVPVYVEVIFYVKRPKYLQKRITMPIKKPDLDNYLKLLLDCIGKVLLPSDSQVTTTLCKKRFGTPARIELLLEADEAGKIGRIPESK